MFLRNVAGLPPEPATQDALNSLAAEMNIGRYHSDRAEGVARNECLSASPDD